MLFALLLSLSDWFYTTGFIHYLLAVIASTTTYFKAVKPYIEKRITLSTNLKNLVGLVVVTFIFFGFYQILGVTATPADAKVLAFADTLKSNNYNIPKDTLVEKNWQLIYRHFSEQEIQIIFAVKDKKPQTAIQQIYGITIERQNELVKHFEEFVLDQLLSTKARGIKKTSSISETAGTKLPV